MKRLFLLIIPVLLGTACAKTVCSESDNEEQVVFRCSLPDMRSSFREDFSQQWHSDDLVGIYGAVSGNSIGKNIPYMVNVCEEDVSKADFEAVSDAMLWAGRGDYVFYAYSPYVMDDFDYKAVPFSLPELQRQEYADDPSGLEEYDIIVAQASLEKKDLTIGEKAEVAFSFRHVFSVVQLNVSADASMRGKRIHKVMMYSDTHPLAGVKGKIDLSVKDRLVRSNAGSYCIALDLVHKPVLSEDAAAMYFMCLPTDEHGCDLHVCVVLESGQMRAFDYKDVVLESNSRIMLNAGFVAEDAFPQNVSFPVCMSMTCRSTQLISAAVLDNTMYFASGAKLERTDAPLKFAGRTQNPYVSSDSWTESSAYIITLPLSEMFYGKFQVDFTFMSRGLANWQTDWSADAENWSRGSIFTLDDSTRATTCSVVFDVPQNAAIPQGGNLYIRIKPRNMDVCSSGATPYFNAASDPRIIGDITISQL